MRPEVAGGFTRLEAILSHPELYEAYPQLKGMPIVNSMDLPTGGDWGKEFVGAAAAYIAGNGKSSLLAVDPSIIKNSKATLLHEIQHAIQDQEHYFAGALSSPDGDAQESRILYYASPQEREALNVEVRLSGSTTNWYEETDPKKADYPERIAISEWDEPRIELLTFLLQNSRQKFLFTRSLEIKARKLLGLPSKAHLAYATRPAPLQWNSPSSPVAPRTKIGRNDPCPCGSSRKFKKCCGKN